jgi:hypothetical protein
MRTGLRIVELQSSTFDVQCSMFDVQGVALPFANSEACLGAARRFLLAGFPESTLP